MHHPAKSRVELYREFIEFIRHDLQKERHQVNRRMFSVFLWCFLLPAIAAASSLLLIRLGILPMRARHYLDWLVLLFPVAYSLYILGIEVILQMPAAFKRGGMAQTLGQPLKEAQWRDRVCEEMKRSVHANAADWAWIISSYRIDMRAMQSRTRYLTALAGAVFFLLMQGIDSLGSDSVPGAWVHNPLLGWMEMAVNDFSQVVGLALFLLLLYLSGNQTYHSLARYLDCAELNQQSPHS